MKILTFLTTFNTELGRVCYTVIPFGATVAGDVFQWKLDECFGKLKQVIISADDIMVVGYKLDHSDHDQAFANLLQKTKKLQGNHKRWYYLQENASTSEAFYILEQELAV